LKRRDRRGLWERQKEPQRSDRGSHTEEAKGVTAGESEGVTKKRQKEPLRMR
jgi:hypothetical protein